MHLWEFSADDLNDCVWRQAFSQASMANLGRLPCELLPLCSRQ
jgi:hypothetical protein